MELEKKGLLASRRPDRIAREDQRLAQEGRVKLKVGDEIRYKHINDLTREDREARISAEMDEVEWPKKRLGLLKDHRQ